MKYLPYIFVVILIAIIILQRSCAPKYEQQPNDTVTVTRIVHDTITILDTLYVPQIKYRYRVQVDTVIDTVEVIKEYYTKNFYFDVLKNDSNAFISVSDTIYQNQIISRESVVKVYPTTIYTTNTITEYEKRRNKVFVGVGVNGWVDRFGASVNFGLLTRKDHLYTLGYDPINSNVNFNMYWKLRLRKK